MKRRDFVKSLTALSVAGSQIPLMAFGRPKHLRTSSGKWNPDRIVIMIKLNGGNDGINTLIPVQDQIYYDLLKKIRIRFHFLLACLNQKFFLIHRTLMK